MGSKNAHRVPRWSLSIVETAVDFAGTARRSPCVMVMADLLKQTDQASAPSADSHLPAPLGTGRKTRASLFKAGHRSIERSPSSPKTAQDLFSSNDGQFDQNAVLHGYRLHRCNVWTVPGRGCCPKATNSALSAILARRGSRRQERRHAVHSLVMRTLCRDMRDRLHGVEMHFPPADYRCSQ